MIKKRASLALIASASLLSLTACGGAGGGNSAESSGDAVTNDGVLTVGANVGSNNQFPQNYNRYGGGDSAPGTDLFYETLFRVSAKDGGALQPNLAESVEWSNDYKTQTYTLRDDVTWNDGEKFTCEDVAYTYNFVYGEPGPMPAEGSEDPVPFLSEPVKCGDDEYTVIVNLNQPDPQRDVPMSLYYAIIPEHVYADKDRETYVDTAPVGTGPGKVTSMAGQRIEVAIRDDYWGGESKGVKSVVIVPNGDAGNIESRITKGEVDIAEGTNPGVLEGFATKEGNGYNYYADGSTRGIIFNTTMEPLNDPAVRRALRDSVDLETVAKVSGIGYSVPTVSGLSQEVFGNLIEAPYNEPLKADVEGAKADLEAAGWTIEGGKLTKDGQSYPLTLNIQNDNPLEMLTAPVVIDQWKKNLGLDVTFDPKPAEVYGAAQAKGEYQMMLWTTNASSSVMNAFTMYQSEKLYDLGDETADGNYGRWEIPAEADQALKNILVTDPNDVDAMKTEIAKVQKAFDEEAPILPLQNGGGGLMFNTTKWAAPPAPGEADYFPRTGSANNFIKTVMNLEPAS